MSDRAGFIQTRYSRKGARLHRWSYDHSGSRSWNWKAVVGRVQVQLTVHRHDGSSDRWVVQPHFIYDRKQR